MRGEPFRATVTALLTRFRSFLGLLARPPACWSCSSPLQAVVKRFDGMGAARRAALLAAARLRDPSSLGRNARRCEPPNAQNACPAGTPREGPQAKRHKC